MHVFSYWEKKKRSEADLFIFDPNPVSRPSGPGAPLFLINGWQPAFHALAFDHLRAVSRAAVFLPSLVLA